MRYEFREGDWVRHRSCSEPLRVIGTGTTIAVQFPNGDMQAFEPCELEKLSIIKLPVRKVHVREHRQDRGFSSDKQFVLVTSMVICLITLVLVVIAFAGQ